MKYLLHVYADRVLHQRKPVMSINFDFSQKDYATKATANIDKSGHKRTETLSCYFVSRGDLTRKSEYYSHSYLSIDRMIPKHETSVGEIEQIELNIMQVYISWTTPQYHETIIVTLMLPPDWLLTTIVYAFYRTAFPLLTYFYIILWQK